MHSSANAHDIRLVCFDLGGVVVRICRTWAEGCQRAGLPAHAELISKHRRSHDWLAANDLYQRGLISRQQFAQQVSELSERLYSPADVETVLDHWLYDCYEGVADLIDDLHQIGITTAALSNSSHDHWQQMSASFQAFNRLHHRFGSHELGMRKPDEEIYREVESRLLVQPRSILFFDDLQENIDGALRCGWNAALINPAGETARQMRQTLLAHNLQLNASSMTESRSAQL